MRQASAHEAEVVREGVRVRTNGDFTMVNVGVMKLREPESVRGLLLVTFRPQPAPVKTAKSRAGAAGKENPGRIASLERDLQTTRESLQTTIEELETANEELKSSNEEMQSTNEELQSTNEEMETSKEEMQSLNEELTTVNAEMLSKVEEMSRANDDMQNLLNSTDVATIFLDRALKIKRYTVQALKLVSLIQSDIGRPLVDLVSKLSYGDLVPDCQEVLRTLVCKVAEVRTTDGYWYLLRIFPYRTAENVIDGVVITFVDINPLKTAEKALLRLSKVFSEGPEPMMLLDLTGLIIALNDEAERGYGWSRQEMLNRPFGMIFAKSAQKTAETALGKCLAGGIVRELEFSSVTKAGREVPGRITLKLLTDDGGQPDSICTLIKHTP
jgi:two-component system CheB/CheR fusion protein